MPGALRRPVRMPRTDCETLSRESFVIYCVCTFQPPTTCHLSGGKCTGTLFVSPTNACISGVAGRKSSSHQLQAEPTLTSTRPPSVSLHRLAAITVDRGQLGASGALRQAPYTARCCCCCCHGGPRPQQYSMASKCLMRMTLETTTTCSLYARQHSSNSAAVRPGRCLACSCRANNHNDYNMYVYIRACVH